MAINVTKCPKCGRLVPPKSGDCLYCGATLQGGNAPPEEPRAGALGAGRNARFKPQSDDRIHVLVTESREPLTLDSGKLFVLGRDARNSLVLHAPDVSRQHAEIDWQGDPPRPVLCEVRSKNGTFLNDRVVTREAPQPLRNGDRIRLGSFQLMYLHATERDLKKELESRAGDDTRELRLPAAGAASAPAPLRPTEVEPPTGIAETLPEPLARPTMARPRPPSGRPPTLSMPRRPMPPDPVRATGARHIPSQGDLDSLVSATLGEGGPRCEGDLAQESGSDLIRRLHEEQATGMLTLADGLTIGEVVLTNGQAQQASWGRNQGRAALTQIVRLRRGTWRFSPGEGATGPLPTSPRDMLKTLLGEKRSGMLSVFDGNDSGEVTLVEGVCEHATMGHLVGRDALNAIMALERGACRFRADDGAGDANGDSGWGGAGGQDPLDDLMSALPLSGEQEVDETPPPAPPPRPPVKRLDPWEVDPDDTLMPSELGGHGRSAPPALIETRPPSERLPAQAADERSRVPPLRHSRGSPELHSQTPLRGPVSGSALRPVPPNAPPTAPPAGGPAGTEPGTSGRSVRRQPPPLPTRSEESGRQKRPE